VRVNLMTMPTLYTVTSMTVMVSFAVFQLHVTSIQYIKLR